MRPALTRRGRVVLAVAVVGFLLGWGFGGRSLNAVVLPAAALLVVGGLSVARIDEPTVERRAPRYGHVGGHRTVELTVESDRPFAATVRDGVGDGLVGDGTMETVADGRSLAYEVRLARRGVHTLGPVRVTATDLFGLWERTFYHGHTARVTVFPKVRPLEETATLLRGYVGLTDEREQFDSLREYEHGDALRNVNWKASAKRPAGDLFVTQFAGEGSTNRVLLAAESVGQRADSVAEATASVAAHLLDAGLQVGVVTPDGRVDPSSGHEHRRRLLALLARLQQGRLRRRHSREADVLVRAPEDGSHVRVEVDRDRHRFDELVGEEVAA